MNKKRVIIICSIVLILAISLFLSTGRARTDVYLKEFSVDEKCNQMIIKVGVSSSAGYVRKMKQTGGSMNYYYTFYSTFGINSKLGAEDTFEIQLDNNVDEIYFYTGGKGYKKVLEKNDNGDWVNAENKYANLLTLDKLKEIVAEKGKNLTWRDFEKYSSTDVGFGMYVRLYNINEDYNLYIGGASVEDEPMYIRLKSTKDENKFIDIREGNIDDFLNMKENEIIEKDKTKIVENAKDNEKNESKKQLDEMKNNFNNGVDTLDTTIFLKDFENYNSVQNKNTITESKAKEIAQKGFEESAKRITQDGADNIESETVRIMDKYANNYFTAYYAEPSKEYENINRKCYVFTRENEIGNGIMVYVDMQTGLIIGGDTFGD